jgi:transposase
MKRRDANVTSIVTKYYALALYAPRGRTSRAPETLLRALLLQASYGVRSERQLMAQVT